MPAPFSLRWRLRPERWALGLSLFQSIGITAVLPIIPLFAQSKGASLQFIGWMVSAYMGGNLAFLYPAGWLSDRMGRRSMMAAGLFCYALAGVGFLWFRDPMAFVALRALEGMAGACFAPAALAYVSECVDEGRRGRAIAGLALTQNVGMLVGPALGGLVASLLGMAAPFWGLVAIGAGGLLIVPYLPGTMHHRSEKPSGVPWDQVRWRYVVGVSSRTFSMGFAVGMFESIWSVYLHQLGGSIQQIAWSWMLFALPSILLAPVAGRVIDRVGPRQPLIWGTLISACMIMTYPIASSIGMLLSLGVIEGIGHAFAFPAQSAAMVSVAPEEIRGRVLGLISAIGTLGSLVGALVVPQLAWAAPMGWFCPAAFLLFLSAGVMAFVFSGATSLQRSAGAA